MAFPTLSDEAVADSLNTGPSELAKKADIVSDSEGGYRITRKRFTKITNEHVVKYIGLAASDRTAIITFYKQVGLTTSFQYTLPSIGSTLWVRFVEYPEIKSMSNAPYWETTIRFEEV